ncbi:MAG: L,D-transpeptidase [Thermoanaerobaculaceae bacterium]|nr:L,D-transpeptidase [Thermoanaerobaculaceae bacterium]
MNAEAIAGLHDEAAAPRRSRWPLALALFVVALLLVTGGATAVLARLGRPFIASPFNATPSVGVDSDNPAGLGKLAGQAAREIAKVQPKGTYIVVDTYRNQLHLIDNGAVIRTAICSTGTGRVLKDPRNGKEWVFDTPMGERIIQRKVTHPVWAKPDWAFIEDGYLPPKDSSERFDNESLGNYAMYIGDGYIIHGTLFQSLLGRSITHGCVRLGDADLEFVYHHAPLGTRVYLY